MTVIVFCAVSATPVPRIVIVIDPPLENFIFGIVTSDCPAGIVCAAPGKVASSSPSTMIKNDPL